MRQKEYQKQHKQWKGTLTTMIVITAALFLAAEGVMQPVAAERFGTPDGMPPSSEGACDDYTGAAYGLCVAYCEAMDSHDEAPNASEGACAVVAQNSEGTNGGLILSEPGWTPNLFRDLGC